MAGARDLLARIASVRTTRRVREISETAFTPRVRVELGAQSARLANVEQHLPRLLNTINSSNGAARMLARRFDELRSDLESGEYQAALQTEYDEHRRALDERISNLGAELAALAEEVRRHAETQGWLLKRVETVRAEMLHELRYGGNPSHGDDQRPPIEIVEPAVLAPGDGGIRLNLGCGQKPVAGYANVDVRRLPGVDVVAPVDELPIEPGTVAEIYSAHLLEHFPEEYLRQTLLPYWVGLLRPGGLFRAVVPDLEAMARAYAGGELDFDVLRTVTYGGQEYEGDTHFNGFNVDRLTAILTGAGLTDVEVVAQGRPEGDCLELELLAIRPV